MKYARLGSTGLNVSRISFGAGPVPALLTASEPDAQRATVKQALELGINWFDTAVTYGDGQSESNLGKALHELSAFDGVHLASKVRLMPEHMADFPASVRESVEGSLRRLRVERLTLLQLHNSITQRAGDQPTSLSAACVLDPGGVLEGMTRVKEAGLVQHLGLTGLGDPAALAQVIQSDRFATIQTPYNLLNPSSGQDVGDDWREPNYGNIMAECAKRRMGVFAIRVFAGGALVGKKASAHTLTTKFFPLDLYKRDARRAARIDRGMQGRMSLKEAALRFVLAHPLVTSAIVGLADPREVTEVAAFADAEALGSDVLQSLVEAAQASEQE